MKSNNLRLEEGGFYSLPGASAPNMLKSIHLASHCASVPIIKPLQAPQAVRPLLGYQAEPTVSPSGLTPRTDPGRLAPAGRRTWALRSPSQGLAPALHTGLLHLLDRLPAPSLPSHSLMKAILSFRGGMAEGALNAELDGDQRHCRQWPRAGGAEAPQSIPARQEADGAPGCTLCTSQGEVNILGAPRQCWEGFLCMGGA